MARILNSKCKMCRRAGEKLFLKGDRCNSPKCAMIRKPYPPGAHGKKKSRGLSEYGRQLAMKQKIKRVYGIMERQFRKHFNEVKHKPGITGDLLLERLEMRLDNIVYRLGFASSRQLARQLVRHGSFLVNGKKVNIPSFKVKVGDKVEISESKKNKNYFIMQLPILKNKKDFPSWIQFDSSTLTGKISAIPKREEVGMNIDPQLVVEYYSR
ncbi:MAG: 30S ribosomal protein S4 [Candidatus Moranbacteria bacterium]|nr:30S ribosomal protein S4 [Candidatus Moranbacteria bacterium]